MKISFLIIVLLFIGCGVPKQFDKKLNVTDSLIESCPKNYVKLKRNWRKHNNENCYYVSSTFYNKGFESTLNSCFLNLTMKETIEILGNPSSVSHATDSIYNRFDVYRYSISPIGNCKYPDWELQFYVEIKKDTIQSINRTVKTIRN